MGTKPSFDWVGCSPSLSTTLGGSRLQLGAPKTKRTLRSAMFKSTCESRQEGGLELVYYLLYAIDTISQSLPVEPYLRPKRGVLFKFNLAWH